MLEVFRCLLSIVSVDKQEAEFKNIALGTTCRFSSVELVKNTVFDGNQMEEYLQSA